MFNVHAHARQMNKIFDCREDLNALITRATASKNFGRNSGAVQSRKSRKNPTPSQLAAARRPFR
jgi:hypothetical protein